MFTDYNIESGTKRVSGPRCGGLSPTYVTAGDTEVELIINGKETAFDNTTTVAFGCTDITLVSITVDNATKITAVISVADNATDQLCTVTTATGSTTTLCSLEIRGSATPSGWHGPLKQAALLLHRLPLKAIMCISAALIIMCIA